MKHGQGPDNVNTHGDPRYPVIGETTETSGELISAIQTAFAMLPDWEIIQAIDALRAANDLYGETLDLGPAPDQECGEKSWQLDGHAICRGPWGHDGGHVWEVQ